MTLCEHLARGANNNNKKRGTASREGQNRPTPAPSKLTTAGAFFSSAPFPRFSTETRATATQKAATRAPRAALASGTAHRRTAAASRPLELGLHRQCVLLQEKRQLSLLLGHGADAKDDKDDGHDEDADDDDDGRPGRFQQTLRYRLLRTAALIAQRVYPAQLSRLLDLFARAWPTRREPRASHARQQQTTTCCAARLLILPRQKTTLAAGRRKIPRGVRVRKDALACPEQCGSQQLAKRPPLAFEIRFVRAFAPRPGTIAIQVFSIETVVCVVFSIFYR